MKIGSTPALSWGAFYLGSGSNALLHRLSLVQA